MKKLYLLPNLLSTESTISHLPEIVKEILSETDGLFIESVKGVGQLFKQLSVQKNIREWNYILLNEHSKFHEISEQLSQIPKTENWAVLSDAGLPGIADPGSMVVRYAHSKGIPVVPISGPSSILLSLIASGLNGQRFCFQGYLPRNEHERNKVISSLERESASRQMTQIFIETPYRNQDLLSALLKTLNPTTQLSIAVDITGKNERFITKSISEFKNQKIEISTDFPAVFLFLASDV